MPDQFKDVTTEGYGSRLGGSIAGVIFGTVLLFISIFLLYWNEGRAVEALVALDHGAKQLIEVASDRIDQAADGKLVHLSGTMTVGTSALDPQFGIGGPDLVRLKRTVEMYQWKEEQHTESHESFGGSKTTETLYRYEKEWSSQPINSAQFKHPEDHRNPPMSVHGETFDSSDAKLGAYNLSSAVLEKINVFKPFIPAPTSVLPEGYRHEGDGFFHGTGNSASPVIGDIKISFSSVGAQPLSVVAGLSGNTLAAFHDTNGYTIVLAEPGISSAEELFRAKKQEEKSLTWILRGVGCVVMLIGFMLIARPLSILLAFLPFLEGIAETGVFLVALTLTLPLTFLTIAFAWIVHRPIIGLALIVAAGISFFLFRRTHHRSDKPRETLNL